jgi:hypothetical protein
LTLYLFKNIFKKKLFSFILVPEDNVERLRNIRDMFENSNDSEEQVILQRVEKVQPSEKLLERLTKYLKKIFFVLFFLKACLNFGFDFF